MRHTRTMRTRTSLPIILLQYVSAVSSMRALTTAIVGTS